MAFCCVNVSVFGWTLVPNETPETANVDQKCHLKDYKKKVMGMKQDFYFSFEGKRKGVGDKNYTAMKEKGKLGLKLLVLKKLSWE